MSFTPGPLPSLALSSMNRDRNIDFKTASKSVEGIAAGSIVARKQGPIVRPKKGDPWESEWLLVVSVWGASSQLDLTPAKVPYKRLMTVADCQAFEPGLVKYYICQLPAKGNPRPLGDTPIACHYLAVGKSFDSINEALEAWECLT